jgi:putative ABC transport system permease protein
MSDLRFAWRALMRTPLLFTTAVLTLAVGTGLATGVFAVVYGVLLRPLPYARPSELVAIQLTYPGAGNREASIGLAEFEDWQRRLRAVNGLAAYATSDFSLRAGSEPRSVRATMVTDGFFDTLGIPSARGSVAEIARGRSTIALSRRLMEQLARDTSAIGAAVTVGTGSFRIAAVMPREFAFPTDKTDLWVPAQDVPDVPLFSSKDHRRFQLVARLASGATLQQAQDDVRRVAKEIDGGLAPGQRRDATVRRLDAVLRENGRAAVLPFAAGAVLVLLIACANVSGLMVGRASARQREYAVRRALGGGTGQVVRACAAENVVIATLGWLLGLWVAWIVMWTFGAQAQGSIRLLSGVRLDAPVLAVSVLLAVLVAIASGSAPALRVLRSDPGTVLKSASERVGGGGTKLRATLVVVQIAITVVLLVSAGLLMRTVGRLVHEEGGFNTDHALAMRLMLSDSARFQVAERAPFIDELVRRTRAVPGVTAAGIGSDLPPNGTQLILTISLVSEQKTERFTLSFAAATPGYLESIGATLRRGRFFEERDRLASPPSAIVTETAARMMFSDGRDPVGRTWPAALPGGAGGQRVKPVIIGVIRDVKYGGLDRPAPATLFATWEKLAPSNAHLVVRTAGSPQDVAAAVRRIVQDLDPALPVFTPQTLDEVVAGSLAERRLRLELAAIFAVMALGLAAIALWGAVAQNVLDRRHELAVRLALGETNSGAILLLVRRGASLVALGLVAGAAGGAMAASTLRHLLHGISPLDAVSFAGGLAVAGLVSMAACYLPARKAAAVSPSELLRQA